MGLACSFSTFLLSLTAPALSPYRLPGLKLRARFIIPHPSGRQAHWRCAGLSKATVHSTQNSLTLTAFLLPIALERTVKWPQAFPLVAKEPRPEGGQGKPRGCLAKQGINSVEPSSCLEEPPDLGSSTPCFSKVTHTLGLSAAHPSLCLRCRRCHPTAWSAR